MPDGVWTALGSHRLLGDGRSVALVTPSGRVEWWCEDLDGEAWLWRLLDRDGAAATWLDADGDGDDGLTRCDTLVDVGGRSVLVREVRAGATPRTVVHELALGGFTSDRAVWVSDSAAVSDGRTVARVRASVGGIIDGHRLCHRSPVDAGGRAVVAVALGPDPLPLDLDALVALADEQRRALDERRRRTLVVGAHPERIRQALAVLDACTSAETGAVIAAPTTSLPEVIGGDRQFDYRYCWVRDASLATSMGALFGAGESAERHLAWVCGYLGSCAEMLCPVATVGGEAVPDERTLDHVEGWRDSSPVRVGNAAKDQLQLDTAGFLAEAVWIDTRTGGRLRRSTWQLLKQMVDAVLERVDEPSNGIWEMREQKRYTSADVGAWLLLDRALRLARARRPWTRRRRWASERDRLRRRVLGAMRADGTLPRAPGDADDSVDAVALLLVLLGLVEGDVAARLVDGTLGRLDMDDGHVRRYPPDVQDGFAAEQGAFVPVSWWAVGALARMGRLEEAERRMDALCRTLPELLPEEFDPVAGIALGNTPLVWSHTEMARAAYLVHVAGLRRRFTPLGLKAWQLARYARLWWRRRRSPA